MLYSNEINTKHQEMMMYVSMLAEQKAQEENESEKFALSTQANFAFIDLAKMTCSHLQKCQAHQKTLDQGGYILLEDAEKEQKAILDQYKLALGLQLYKGGSLDLLKPVQVYKNLHKGLFSIKQNGKVVAHTRQLILNNASFVVNESGRQRVIEEKRKNVHALIVGTISLAAAMPILSERISYNPYKSGSFYFVNMDEAIDKEETIDHVYLNADMGVYMAEQV